MPNNRILTQKLYYNYSYQSPKYTIIGYLDPLGPISLKSPGLLGSDEHWKRGREPTEEQTDWQVEISTNS